MQSLNLFLSAAVFSFSALALAQEPQGPGARRANREEVQGMMDAYIISKLQEALQLTDDQYARMIVAQKKLQEHRREHQRRRMEILRELQRTVSAPDPSDGEITPLLEKLQKNQLDFQTEQQADYKAIDAILSVKQRARHRLLEVEIERRLQELVREIRQQRLPQRPQF